ncbi:M64 family metallopeptidase [Aeoliella sp. ICT_H6.2]|uniref:M64 family metallopeptidase n=1 Tax=Aeoliella straminimaris TaxID=2954799 RepID=A0A9X2FI45_9BACT|nr:M64 family metallopeptidase [Aeoliella straminimaris]MCO6045571.1 M64 family metallopeptidase [Aeoliella straminimaris]
MHGCRSTRCSLAWILVFANCSLAAAEWTTLVDNGPSENRVDIVTLGDGYTQADLTAGVYEQHIHSYLDHLFAASINSEPFHRYRKYFNVHAVEVVSSESGADVPPQGVFKDTALDAQYYGDGVTERLLTIDQGKANSARDVALANADFSAEMQYVAVNETKYGGSGGPYAVFAGGNSASNEIALHEVGHSFSNLADEYPHGVSPSHYDAPEPSQVNVTADPTGAKWAHWINHLQPGVGVIGAYEGANYHRTGIYRSSLDSKMKSLHEPFNAVSREKIILDIYELVDPLDDWTDNSLPLNNPLQLEASPIDEDIIDFQWFVDGVMIAGANQATFQLMDYDFGAGDYGITLRAYDPTGFDPVDGWVRMNQSNLEQFVTWQVTLGGSQPLPGDYDGNLIVDQADYTVWRNSFNQEVQPHFGADGNGNGIVDLADYNVWRGHLGQTASSQSSAAAHVAEPATFWLSLAAVLLVLPYRAK